ncbi:MAG: NAD(P)/FAD-dependent oxidoreductase [Desulfurella sp.]|uniref:NAD(P)/FAD-dependent oxidoreductase n=1 Tax=Desulfurella sp. TaxID=1962857 RepID=UPI003D0CCE72
MYNAIIVGAGTSGLACACFCKGKTLLIDKQSAGKKLSIAGNERVNLTNLADLNEFLKAYVPNGEFLRNAFKIFFRDDLLRFINTLNLDIEVENNKVFLKNSNGKILVNKLKNFILNRNIHLVENEKVIKIEKKETFIVYTSRNIYKSKNLVIATGGLARKKLGASADGYMFAKSLGHTIIPPKPFETPFCIKDSLFENLSGISLYVQIKYKNKIFSGDMLFTHFGLSGPVILEASCFVKNCDIININFLGKNKDIFFKELEKAKSIKLLIKDYLPKRFINNISKKIPFIEKNINQVSKKNIHFAFELLCNYKINIKLCGFDRAFVTKGGINLKEVDPKSCSSKLVSNLFFCGEILDIAGPIGGFNIQAAFSTGYLVSQKLGNLPFTNI